MTGEALAQDNFIALLDEVIPAASESIPGAGSLGLTEDIEANLGETASLVASGLAALEEKARERFDASFAEMPAESRAALVEEVATAIPGFIETLVYHTYTAYYQHPKVAVAIGLRAEPPFPNGYELEVGDLGLLDAVRRRSKLFREA